MFDLGNMMSLEAMMAPEHSPYPWHVRLGGYRIGLPVRSTIPQRLADEWTEVMQAAVMAWANRLTLQPDFGFIDDLDDEMVKRRIAGYQEGYDKEWSRREVGGYWHDFQGERKERYDFEAMPLSLQRAIVSRWDGLHDRWLEGHSPIVYTPDFGYHWRITEGIAYADGFKGITTVKVKMFDRIDQGKPPDKAQAEEWEKSGFPGGLWGFEAADSRRLAPSQWLYVEGVEPPDLSIKRVDRE